MYFKIPLSNWFLKVNWLQPLQIRGYALNLHIASNVLYRDSVKRTLIYNVSCRAVLGSVSDYCAHHAKCPVIIVKKPHWRSLVLNKEALYYFIGPYCKVIVRINPMLRKLAHKQCKWIVSKLSSIKMLETSHECAILVQI